MTRKRQFCFSVFVGAANRTGGRRFSSRRKAIIHDVTRKYFPTGATILEARGTWCDPETGALVDEEARQILVCASSRRALRPWCEALLTALNQKELLVVQLGAAFTVAAKAQHNKSSVANARSHAG